MGFHVRMSGDGGRKSSSGGFTVGRSGGDASLRGWTMQMPDGRLILRRSVLIRCLAVPVAVVGAIWMALLALQMLDPLTSGFDRSDDAIFVVLLSIPTVWAVNVLRRRTVLSEYGVEMRRLLFTERRPWASVLSRLTLSTFDMSGPGAESGIDRTRIALVNGDLDDVIRLPGCVLGTTLVDSRKRGSAALRALLNYVDGQGWIVSDTDLGWEDPGLVRARQSHGADEIAQRSRLVFCVPAWRRIKEHFCNGGMFLIGLGVLLLAMGGQQLLFESSPLSASDRFYAVLFLILGPLSMAPPLYRIYGCFQRVIVDDKEIRAGGKSCAWPESRSGLFVVGDRIFLACAGGRGIALDGAGVTWGGFQRRQERLVARCEAIWLWGVAHGATRESGRYVPVRDESMQREREILEKGMGMAVPRRG